MEKGLKLETRSFNTEQKENEGPCVYLVGEGLPVAVGELQLHEGVVKERRHVVLLSEKKFSETLRLFVKYKQWRINTKLSSHLLTEQEFKSLIIL